MILLDLELYTNVAYSPTGSIVADVSLTQEPFESHPSIHSPLAHLYAQGLVGASLEDMFMVVIEYLCLAQ